MTKRALLVGCNYPGSEAALNGCVNDVNRLKSMLVEVFGFEPGNIKVLIDTDPSFESPTGGNIRKELAAKVAESKPGDVLVFHFSGHGSQVPDAAGREKDGKDECICPTDMNVMVDDDLRRILKKLPDGVKFTMIADCCHSGTMLDHQEVQIAGNKDPNAPEIPDLGSLGALFGFKGAAQDVGDRGIKNRSLSVETLFSMLGQSSGSSVDSSNIHATLSGLFGADASPLLSQMAGMAVPMLMNSMGGAGQQNGESGRKTGYVRVGERWNSKVGKQGGGCSCLPMLSSLLGSLSSTGGPPKPPPQSAAYQVPSGHIAGQKPPVSEQLPDDKGILITGCQAHETSADACPSGDPSQAYGALSNAIQVAVKAHYAATPGQPLTYRELVLRVRTILHKTGFTQNPCLECSDAHADDVFICEPSGLTP